MTRESQHLLNVLRSAIRILGYSYNDVGAKLGVGNGYLSRLFSGKIELKVDHVVEISRAIGFEPWEILHLAYPPGQEPPSKAAARYRELVAGVEPAPESRPLRLPTEPAGESDLETAVAKTLQKLLAPAPPPRPAVATEEDVEKIVDRMLRKFFGNMAQAKAE